MLGLEKTWIPTYLVYFRGQNFNFSQPLKGIIIRFSKQSNWFTSFSKTSNHLNTTNDKVKKKQNTLRVKCTTMHVDLPPVVTESLAVFLLLVPFPILDQPRWTNHLRRCYQSSVRKMTRIFTHYLKYVQVTNSMSSMKHTV